MSVEVFGKPVNKRHKMYKVHTQEQEIPKNINQTMQRNAELEALLLKLGGFIRWFVLE